MKYGLLIASILFSFQLRAQLSLNIMEENMTSVTFDTIDVSMPINSLLITHLKVKNEGNSDMVIQVKREAEVMPSGYTNYFCWGIQCYPASANQSVYSETIAPNVINGTFVSYVNSGATPENWRITYTFFLEGDPTKFSSVTLRGTTFDNTGIENATNTESSLSVFPNPVTDNASFKYKLNNGPAKIVISDITGKAVKEIYLTAGSNMANADLSGLNKGVYLYSLVEGGFKISKKLVIR